jgi:hypothetical protein
MSACTVAAHGAIPRASVKIEKRLKANNLLAEYRFTDVDDI